MNTFTARLVSVALAAMLVAPLLVSTAGCFSKGKKGYMCSSSKDCAGKLRCKTFRGGGKKRRACVPPGTRHIRSDETYTKWAVYMSWGAVVVLPIGLAALIIVGRRKSAQMAAQGPQGPQQPRGPQPPQGPQA